MKHIMILSAFATMIFVSLSNICYGQDIKPNIYYGNDAKKNKVHTSLYNRRNDGQYYFNCGATIISPNFVLTAAHCVDGSNGIILGIGGIRLRKHNHMRTSKRIIFLGEYSPFTLDNDVALIELNEPVNNYTYAKVAKRVRKGTGRIFGNGRSETGNTSFKLQTAKVNIRKDNDCYVFDDFNKNTHICIYSEASVSFGDSGGGLYNRKGEVVGVASYVLVGGGRQILDAPEFYQRVDTFREKIFDIID